MDETFTLLPLHLSPSPPTLTSPLPYLTPHLARLTNLHSLILPLPSSHPPPPLPLNPRRSAQIQKMRDQGNTTLRPSKTSSSSTASPSQALEAITLYTYGIEMALGRPSWEPAQLVREEASVLFANRAQAYMMRGAWAEGAADAETSVGLRRGGNGKAWWRRGRCLVEMGRWGDAEGWVREGLEIEGNETDLAPLMKEIKAHLEREGK